MELMRRKKGGNLVIAALVRRLVQIYGAGIALRYLFNAAAGMGRHVDCNFSSHGPNEFHSPETAQSALNVVLTSGASITSGFVFWYIIAHIFAPPLRESNSKLLLSILATDREPSFRFGVLNCAYKLPLSVHVPLKYGAFGGSVAFALVWPKVNARATAAMPPVVLI